MRNRFNKVSASVLSLLFLWLNPLICISSQAQNQIEDPDFIKVPQTYIRFSIMHVLIKPTEKILFERTTRIKTEPGKSAEYSLYMPSANKDYFKIRLTPFIVEGKGIDLKIEITNNEKTVKVEKVIKRNYGTIVVELLKNTLDNMIFAEQISISSQTIEPAKPYAGPIPPLILKAYRLYINDKLISERRIEGDYKNLLAVSAKYIGFFVPNKGAYILSFSPFEGAEPIGVADYNIIKFRQEGDYFEFISMRKIIPEGKWLVWVRYNKDYDLAKDFHFPEYISEDSGITTRPEIQRNTPDVKFWFTSDHKIVEMVFRKKK